MENPHFVVSWTIDILDAASPEEAARRAFAVIRETDPTIHDSACVFEVREAGGGEPVTVDLFEVGA